MVVVACQNLISYLMATCHGKSVSILTNSFQHKSHIDRTREIGTLRAIGASRLFISLQCMIETFILAIMAGIIGSIFGCIAARIITHAQIVFKNAFLIQLFGGNALITEVTANNLGSVSLLVLVIGIVGWIYPVQAALKVNPVEAMQGAK